jgi:hypothetical protein
MKGKFFCYKPGRHAFGFLIKHGMGIEYFTKPGKLGEGKAELFMDGQDGHVSLNNYGISTKPHHRRMKSFFCWVLCGWFCFGACTPANTADTAPNGDPLAAALRAVRWQHFQWKLDSLSQPLQGWLQGSGYNSEQAIVCDLGMHSGLCRMVVWNLKTRKIVDSGLVAHGSGGGYLLSRRFSATR